MMLHGNADTPGGYPAASESDTNGDSNPRKFQSISRPDFTRPDFELVESRPRPVYPSMPPAPLGVSGASGIQNGSRSVAGEPPQPGSTGRRWGGSYAAAAVGSAHWSDPPISGPFSDEVRSVEVKEVERVAGVLDMLAEMLRARGSRALSGWGPPQDLESALQFYVKGYLLGKSEPDSVTGADDSVVNLGGSSLNPSAVDPPTSVS